MPFPNSDSKKKGKNTHTTVTPEQARAKAKEMMENDEFRGCIIRMMPNEEGCEIQTLRMRLHDEMGAIYGLVCNALSSVEPEDRDRWMEDMHKALDMALEAYLKQQGEVE